VDSTTPGCGGSVRNDTRLKGKPSLAICTDSVWDCVDLNVMDHISLFRMNFDSGAVALGAGVRSRQSLFRCRGNPGLPFGPTRCHAYVAHVTRIGVDKISDALRILPRRPVSKALWPGHEPPHAHKLLGDVILGLSIGRAVQQAECQEHRNRDHLFHRLHLSTDVRLGPSKPNPWLRWPDRSRMVGYPSSTFSRNLGSTPNPEFERVLPGCAVIQDLVAPERLNFGR